MQHGIKFCQHCGNRLSEASIEGKTRQHCAECGHVVFLDPKLAAVVLIGEERRLLMVKRGVEPALGAWAFPSGYVDRGESVEQAAVREVQEETGLVVELNTMVGLYSRAESHVVLAVYDARITGGGLRAGYDAEEVDWFSLGKLPPLPFPHDTQILSDWLGLYPHWR
ncbi:MAG: NUDIX domain-containing protein [Chloroflexi bacterium]|nr:NUDIX domain-containing protein [Chloroflexota bacterium]